MSKLNNLISCFTATMTAMAITSSQAQFADALVLETPVGVNTGTVNTANDIKDIGNKTYEVSVWDDPLNQTAGLSWNVAGISNGWISLSQPDATDPDVCLISNAVSVFALVAYHSTSSNHFYIDVYNFSGNPGAFSYANTMPVFPGDYGTSLNIDASINGEFIMVWDNPGGQISIITGYTTVGQFPAFNQGGAALMLPDGKYPDASIYYVNPASGLDTQVDVVYVDMNGRVAVDYYRLVDLALGAAFPSNSYVSPPADFAYHHPRIAMPGEAGLPQYLEDWTVVVEDNDGASTWFIKSINHRTGVYPETVFATYNDGTSFNSPLNTSDVPNLRPVLTYDKSYATIWIGWTVDNTSGLIPSGAAAIAKYPVGLICTRNARIINGFPYYMMPSVLPPGAQYGQLSMAGRNSTKGMLTFHEEPMFDIYNKTIQHLPPPAGFRETFENTSLNEWLHGVETGLFETDRDKICTLILHDASGRNILTLREKASGLRTSLARRTYELPAQVYLGRVFSDDASVSYSGKLVLGE